MDNASQEKLTLEEETQLIKKIDSQINRGEISKINQKSIKVLIQGLCTTNGLKRRDYSERLGKIGKGALPELVHVLLNSKNVIQRRAAAKTLKLVGEPAALPHLTKALTNDSDKVVQCSAAGAMAIFGNQAVSHLIMILENVKYTEMQHGLAAWCLAFIGSKAPNEIKEAAQSKNNNVKSAAIFALEEQIRELQDKEAIKILKSTLQDDAENVQIEAIKLAGKINKLESIVPILIEKLQNKNPEIRKATVLSLMQLNIQDALAPLKNTLEIEKEVYIKNLIKLAINKIEL